MYTTREQAGFLMKEAAPFSCTIACRQERMLCQKDGEGLYGMHSNQHRPLTPSTLRIQWMTLCLAEVICDPVQQGCFIAHLSVQLSAAMLIIDAALCDFEVKTKVNSAFKLGDLNAFSPLLSYDIVTNGCFWSCQSREATSVDKSGL